MATKKVKDEVAKLDDAALNDRITAERMSLTKTVFAHAVTPLDNPMSIRIQRRSIAKLLTEVSSRKAKA